MICRTMCACLFATMALAVAGCAQTSASKVGGPAKAGGLVHTPAPPPPEIHDDATSPRLPVAGGYTDAGPVSENDANQKAARDFAVAAIYKKFPQRSLVESSTVRTQVVAGLNYQFHIVMTGGGAYDAVVYRDLEGKMSLSSLNPAAN